MTERPNVGWDEMDNCWSARYPDGAIVRSSSLSELEQFIDMIELRNGNKASSVRQAAWTWGLSVGGMLLIVAVSMAAAWLW